MPLLRRFSPPYELSTVDSAALVEHDTFVFAFRLGVTAAVRWWLVLWGVFPSAVDGVSGQEELYRKLLRTCAPKFVPQVWGLFVVVDELMTLHFCHLCFFSLLVAACGGGWWCQQTALLGDSRSC